MTSRDAYRGMLARLGADTYASVSGRSRFAAWLETSSAYDVLDDAVMGSLDANYVDELCEDFGITRAEFSRALDDALSKGW